MEQPTKVTVEELDALVKTIAEKRLEKDQIGEKLTEVNKQIMELEAKAVYYLKELDRKSYASEHGTVSRVEKWRVNLPTSREAKEAVAHWLHDSGIFWDYFTMNSNAFNSLYLEKWEQAKEAGEGMDFKIPGIEPAKLSEIVSFRRK